MLNRIKYLYAILVVATVTLATTAAWLVSSVLVETNRINEIPRDTLIGIASQTSHELHQLIYALEQFKSPEPEINASKVVTRFDILWSRETTNTSGPIGRAFNELEGVAEFQTRLKDVLRKTEADVVSLKVGETEKAAGLVKEFRSLVVGLNSITLRTTAHATQLTAYHYQEFQEVAKWALILMACMFVTALVVAVILLNERRALNNLAKTLEERVAERTRDLQKANNALMQEMEERKALEAKLIQSQKMEIVGQLTGGIAHDFNNLLAIIQGNAELLDSFVDERDRRLVKPIIHSTQRGSELTQRLLAFSRKQPLRPESIEIKELIEGMRDLLDRALGEVVELHISSDDDVWPALVDTGQLENAILNLAVNASQAMPAGGDLYIHIENHVLKESASHEHETINSGDYVCISVRDTGTGMDSETVERAFEPFYTTKEVGKGSGLGLSMVYGFAQQSGGFTQLQSEVGKGTTVKIFVPRSMQEADPKPVLNNETEATRGNGETIFVLEDNPEVLTLTEKLLTSLNYAVVSAASTDEATKLLSSPTKINLILSDVVLPGGKSGPEYFKSNPDLVKNTQIIYMSGYPAEVVKAKEQKEWDGRDLLISKPFKRKELAQYIHQALTNSPKESVS